MTEDTTTTPTSTNTGGNWLKPGTIVALGIASIFVMLATTILISVIGQMTGSLPSWAGKGVVMIIGVGAIIGGDFLYRKRDLKIAGGALIGTGGIIVIVSVFSLIMANGMLPDFSGLIPQGLAGVDPITKLALIFWVIGAVYGLWVMYKKGVGRWPERFAYTFFGTIFVAGASVLAWKQMSEKLQDVIREGIATPIIDFLKAFMWRLARIGENLATEDGDEITNAFAGVSDTQLIAGTVLFILIIYFLTKKWWKSAILVIFLFMSIWFVLPEDTRKNFGENIDSTAGAVAEKIALAGETFGGGAGKGLKDWWEGDQEGGIPEGKILTVEVPQHFEQDKVVRMTAEIDLDGGVKTWEPRHEYSRHFGTNHVTCYGYSLTRVHVHRGWIATHNINVDGHTPMTTYPGDDPSYLMGSHKMLWSVPPDIKYQVEDINESKKDSSKKIEKIDIVVEMLETEKKFQLLDDEGELMIFPTNDKVKILRECREQFKDRIILGFRYD